MGISRHLNIGWYCVLNIDEHYYDACQELAELNPEWEGFIVGTDPICGSANNICIFSVTEDSQYVDADDYVEMELDAEKRPLSEKAELFIKDFKAKFGEDSIVVKYGLINWFS